MSFDGIVTKSLVTELNNILIGGRVDKIFQQEKDEILINVRSKGVNQRLLISASSNNARIYLTDSTKKNPESPPMFCMLLRKHLAGGTILNIEQYNMDRIIFIDISSLDELGQSSEKRLVIELMGKHSNIMLVDKASLKIIDSIKRVTEDMSRVRQILPGLIYEYPPTNNKINPLESTLIQFNEFIKSEKESTPIFKFFYFNYLGLSPLISREICFNADVDPKSSIDSLRKDELSRLYICFMSVVLLDTVYKRKDIGDRIGQRSHSIRKSIGVKLERSINKLEKQEQELTNSIDREIYKIYADLISANMHNIKTGTEEIQVENFYDENLSLISIPLDKKISPAFNAQKYYKKYSKLKTANTLLLKEIPETKNEIIYLENVLLSIENSTEINELNEIKEELVEEGYIKDFNKNRKKKKKQEALSKPHEYISNDGYSIYVGKNNKQNDYLTLKFAHKEDMFLHVYNMPGSHVIIKNKDDVIPNTTIEEAATLAAHFSSGKNGSHIPVAYTERKNVKKPKGAKTGMVIFNNYKTMTITPTEELVNGIKKVED